MNSPAPRYAVTGASGYTGKYITRRLLENGGQILNLSGHPDRPHEFGGELQTRPLSFDRPQELAESLRGVQTLFNTYWVRFNYGKTTYGLAVRNTRIMLEAACRAGVQRIVHVSIANPSLDSPLPYYRGKAELERAIRESGLSYAILRPTVIFGREDILINNIAYLLRRLPVFAIPGSGEYGIQPIFVEDMADLAVQAAERREDFTQDAAGPEIFTFTRLVEILDRAVGGRTWLVHLPPGLALTLARLIGPFVGDVVLTEDEVAGLSGGLLVSEQPPTGWTTFSEWIDANAHLLGRVYASELKRHYRRP